MTAESSFASSSDDLRGMHVAVLAPMPTHPVDRGNRKRILQSTLGLKCRGARITYLYYSHGWGGRGDFRGELAAMERQWDQVFVVPGSGVAQRPPRGAEHLIDEWRDPSVATFLEWFFSRQRVDVLWVHYAWLSYALCHAPPGTVRVLETQDRFSNRVRLYEQCGVPPEFFYTTQEEECIALRRADLTIAIKEEDANFFRALVPDLVVQTLCYFEPPVRHEPPQQQQTLRVGIISSDNNLNAVNISRFLRSAVARFRRRLAPVHVHVGGRVTQMLPEINYSDVNLLGSCATPGEFYSKVDAVIVADADGSGVKTKVGEALAHGVPVFAHRHSFEGYSPRHPYHQCGTFEELANAVVETSFDRSKLEDLFHAGQAAHGESALACRDAWARVCTELTRLMTNVLVIPPEGFDDARSLEFYRFRDVLRNALARQRAWVASPEGLVPAETLESHDERIGVGGVRLDGVPPREFDLVWLMDLERANEAARYRPRRIVIDTLQPMASPPENEIAHIPRLVLTSCLAECFEMQRELPITAIAARPASMDIRVTSLEALWSARSTRVASFLVVTESAELAAPITAAIAAVTGDLYSVRVVTREELSASDTPLVTHVALSSVVRDLSRLGPRPHCAVSAHDWQDPSFERFWALISASGIPRLEIRGVSSPELAGIRRTTISTLTELLEGLTSSTNRLFTLPDPPASNNEAEWRSIVERAFG